MLSKNVLQALADDVVPTLRRNVPGGGPLTKTASVQTIQTLTVEGHQCRIAVKVELLSVMAHLMDWADKIADEMMARTNGSAERLEALRHEMAKALRSEREACAKIADAENANVYGQPFRDGDAGYDWTAKVIAERIRARST